MAATRRSSKSGAEPGYLVHVGDKKRADSRITVIDYNVEGVSEKTQSGITGCFALTGRKGITWINVDGLQDTSVIQKLGDCFKLHPLIQEDILNTEQRPKTEDYGGYIFVVLRMLDYTAGKTLDNEQVSLVLGKNFVLSFQENVGDVWDPVRERIRNDKGRIRKEGSDYLAYSLMDAIVDNYFTIMEKLGDEVEDVEEDLMRKPTQQTLKIIQSLKRRMIAVRRSVWPFRDVVHSLQGTDNPLIAEATKIYLRDIYDHTIQVIDNIESARDVVSGMIDIYLSSVSNRLNEIVKVLTILSVIFIPLTFIAGVYGMNFKYMPELGQPWGYPAALSLMALVAAGLIVFFKRRKWF